MQTVKKIKAALLLVAGLLVLSAFRLSAGADDGVLKTILKKLETYRNTYQPEKMYLQTDRHLYAADDTVWYKARVVNAATNLPVLTDQIAHIYLLTADNKTVLHRKLLLTKGQSSSYFVVPAAVSTGPYMLQAFTNWMQNAGPAFFFSKPIQVISLEDDEPLADLNDGNSSEAATLQFYPEGGSLVAGIMSRIAFKALDKNGLGTAVKGDILDQGGKVVASFESLQAGIGVFDFRPEKDKTYTVRTLSKNNLKSVIFPKVQPSGYSLAVNNKADSSFAVIVQASPDLVQKKESLYVVVQAGGVAYFTATASLAGRPFVSIQFPRSKMPDGVAQVSLFDQQGVVIGERLFFNNRQRNLRISILPDKAAYQRREKVNLAIEVTDENGTPVAADLALSVTNAALSLQKNHPKSQIFSSLLLTSDLAIPIEDPKNYFTNPTPETKVQLDNLLLTQSWKRFNWIDLQPETNLKLAYNRETEMLVKGKLVNEKTRNPVADATLWIMVSSTGDVYKTTSDKQGSFAIPVSDYLGQQRLVYQVLVQDKQVQEIKLILDEPRFMVPALPVASNGPDVTLLRQQARHRQQISQAFGKQYQPGNLVKAVHNRENTPADYTFSLADYDTFDNLHDFIREVISPVSLVNNQGRKEPRVFSRERNNTFMAGRPLYLIDGHPTLDTDFVLALPNEKIKAVEVISSIKNLQKFGYFGQHGVIAIYTKNGNFNPAELTNDAAVYFQGLIKNKAFYQPEHTKPATKRLPDFRQTIYWNPNLRTDANGKAVISFYASDDISDFTITTEGFSGNGKVGSGTASLKIIAPE